MNPKRELNMAEFDESKYKKRNAIFMKKNSNFLNSEDYSHNNNKRLANKVENKRKRKMTYDQISQKKWELDTKSANDKNNTSKRNSILTNSEYRIEGNMQKRNAIFIKNPKKLSFGKSNFFKNEVKFRP